MARDHEPFSPLEPNSPSHPPTLSRRRGVAQALFDAQSVELSNQLPPFEREAEKKLALVYEMLMRSEIASFEIREAHLSSLLGDLGGADAIGLVATVASVGGPRAMEGAPGREELKTPC
jgi:hypothetical protein